MCGRTEERSGSREGTGELACSFSVWVSMVLANGSERLKECRGWRKESPDRYFKKISVYIDTWRVRTLYNLIMYSNS